MRMQAISIIATMMLVMGGVGVSMAANTSDELINEAAKNPNVGGGVINAIASSTLSASDKKVAQEEALSLGAGGGAMASTSSVASVGSTNVGNRTTMTSGMIADSGAMHFDMSSDTSTLVAVNDGSNGMSNGIGIWVQPMYKRINSDGFESQGNAYSYDTNIFGVSVGSDYTFANSSRVGAALHLGTGDSESDGGITTTKNDFDYVGGSIYAGYMLGNFGLSADIGYTTTDNEVSQSGVGVNQKTDFDADVFSIGTRAEYRMTLNSFNLIPHVGLRYTYSSVDDYTTKNANGANAIHSKTDSASVFTIPMGVQFVKPITIANGIVLTPSIDLGVQFAMGDLDVEQNVRIAGLAGSANMESEVFDPATFQGGLGLGVVKDGLSLNLGYDLDISSNVTSHGVMGTVRFDF